METPRDQYFGRRRVVIENVRPSIDGGRHPVKRIVGDWLEVSCDLVVDGHDAIAGAFHLQPPDGSPTREAPLVHAGNDRWTTRLRLDDVGVFSFHVEAWLNDFSSWRVGVARKHEANQDISVELSGGLDLVRQIRARSSGDASARLDEILRDLEHAPDERRLLVLLSAELHDLSNAHPDRRFGSVSVTFSVVVDPVRAQCSAWYELFPRSLGKDGQHGTFADVVALLPYVASMGFDVLYLPPVHPIGKQFRKGPNNALEAGPLDPGSPWAIGGVEGGHKAIHPELGTVEQFTALVATARAAGLEIAIDIAFQASPDHPYVEEHPEWFVHRADGTIQYAENPPKKYQDVYPFDLSGPAAQPLWEELVSVFEVWIERGVRFFRVDNPHTKPIPFWEYCIDRLKRQHPDVVFLAEAFTRPKVTYALAKVGFSQSYTYFTWRTTAPELRAYLEELTQTEVREFFRPNFWPNTPDILPEHLQFGGRPMFIARLMLAGTLSASWGIYGPAFELMESVARPGSEEYIDNEKYQLRQWNLQQKDSLAPIIRRLNTIRRENPALQRNDTLVFHDCDNDSVIAYSKSDPDSGNVVVCVINLDPQHRHAAWLDLDLSVLEMDPGDVFQVHDLLSDARYQWHGSRVFVELDPAVMPAHLFKVRRKVRSEASFEYYL